MSINSEINRITGNIAAAYVAAAELGATMPQRPNSENLAGTILGIPVYSKPVTEELHVTANGFYIPPDGVDGYSSVTVEVDAGGILPPTDPHVASLEVRKVTSNTCFDSISRFAEQFVMLRVVPKPNGTVNVTYGGLTKSVTDESGVSDPKHQTVFFGTYAGVSDTVDTPQSGLMTISGDYRSFGAASYTVEKGTLSVCDCITKIFSFGNMEYLLDYAFDLCSTLTGELVIPEGMTSITNRAFNGCNFTDITIPSSVTEIDAEALNGINDPKTLRVLASSPPKLYDSDSIGIDYGNTTIIVPAGCSEAYKTAEYWSSYADYITEEEA
jgi:hypothetical protein